MPRGQVIMGMVLVYKKKKRTLIPSQVLTMQQTLCPHQQTQADFTLVLLIERNIPKCANPAASQTVIHIKT